MFGSFDLRGNAEHALKRIQEQNRDGTTVVRKRENLCRGKKENSYMNDIFNP
jgi:hypothetical protein